MSEADQRTKVVKLLKSLHSIPVENPVWPGTPDVNFIGGWMELKWLRAWPDRPSTIVHLDHYTKQQQFFARQRLKYGEQVWFLLQCRREWLLLRGEVAAEYVNKTTREDLISVAHKYWPSGINQEELLLCLSRS